MAGLDRRDARKLPALEDFADDSIVQETLPFSKRHLVNVVEHEALPNVVVRVTPLFVQVERVAREGAIPGRRNERVRRIVDGVSPRIRGLQLQTVLYAVGELRLQAMVNSVADRHLVKRLKHG